MAHKSPLYISPTIDLFISMAISVVGVAINWKHLRNINEDYRKRDSGTDGCILNNILKCNAKVIIVVCPYYLLLFWFLNENYELPPWFQYALCYDQYIVTTLRIYVAFNSLVIATMRYIFIVHNKLVLKFGKANVKTMFYYGSIAIPVFLGVLNGCSIKLPRHVQQLPQTICVDFYLDTLNITLEESDAIPDFGSPILSFLQQYVPMELTSYVQTFVTIVGLLILSNLLEAVLYWRTFSVIRQ